MLKTVKLALLISSMGIFANSNAGSKVYISSTAHNEEMLQADYESLTWIEVKGVGNFGETGENTNILTYDTWDTTVTQKAKGITDAGSPDVEVARIPTDPGQVQLRFASSTNLNWCIKTVRNDAAVVGGTGTIIYNRGLVTGPRRPQGRNEDFDIEVFSLALNQLEVVVNPSGSGVPPTSTVLPAITGTATVGQVLTVSTGTFTGDATITYQRQWFAGGVAIPGATSNTFTLTSAQLGKIITARVVATNAAGSAFAFSGATSAVA